ncbi:hypothetical protein [Streptococcus suis]|uniref:Transmembrane protein n=2 Tax=Streptococcus suis TaxID=1307 RepID=A0AAN2RDC8_STRSU|nr:hypothetical protein [Streptococcus suis]NQH73725.1 hypothetical protein [Streptococcus suis]CYU44951.1 Uncharacterised protein [Streptococcus suis]
MQNLMNNLSTILTVILTCIELLRHLYHFSSSSQQSTISDKRPKKYPNLGSNISKEQDNNLIKNYILENIFILIICVLSISVVYVVVLLFDIGNTTIEGSIFRSIVREVDLLLLILIQIIFCRMVIFFSHLYNSESQTKDKESDCLLNIQTIGISVLVSYSMHVIVIAVLLFAWQKTPYYINQVEFDNYTNEELTIKYADEVLTVPKGTYFKLPPTAVEENFPNERKLSIQYPSVWTLETETKIILKEGTKLYLVSEAFVQKGENIIQSVRDKTGVILVEESEVTITSIDSEKQTYQVVIGESHNPEFHKFNFTLSAVPFINFLFIIIIIIVVVVVFVSKIIFRLVSTFLPITSLLIILYIVILIVAGYLKIHDLDIGDFWILFTIISFSGTLDLYKKLTKK